MKPTLQHSKFVRVIQSLRLTLVDSDTTAPSLVFLLYCIAKHPEHADRIYAELGEVDPLDLSAVSALPHLNGAINEAMRLYSVAPTTVSRQTPPQGVMIGDTFIPGDTKVLSPRWVTFNRKSHAATARRAMLIGFQERIASYALTNSSQNVGIADPK